MSADITTETGCTILVRDFPMGGSDKIALLLDMGAADGRITPEVLLTRAEAWDLASALSQASSR